MLKFKQEPCHRRHITAEWWEANKKRQDRAAIRFWSMAFAWALSMSVNCLMIDLCNKQTAQIKELTTPPKLNGGVALSGDATITTCGSYTLTNVTVDSQGRITAAKLAP